jgi:transcriptional regulator with XRE-family HTH domain
VSGTWSKTTPGFNGRRLRAARRAKGLTQGQLGEMIGVDQSSVAGYELGPHTPPSNIFKGIIKALGRSRRHFTETSSRDDSIEMDRKTPGFDGGKLRAMRRARKLSQAAMADLIGVGQQVVSLYERGISTPSPLVAKRIAAIFPAD